MLAAARMQPKKHTLIIRLSYKHLAGAHGFLHNMFPCFRRSESVWWPLSVCIICDRPRGPCTLPCPGPTSSDLKWSSNNLVKTHPNRGEKLYFPPDISSGQLSYYLNPPDDLRPLKVVFYFHFHFCLPVWRGCSGWGGGVWAWRHIIRRAVIGGAVSPDTAVIVLCGGSSAPVESSAPKSAAALLAALLLRRIWIKLAECSYRC